MSFRKKEHRVKLASSSSWSEKREKVDVDGYVSFVDVSCEEIDKQQLDSHILTPHSMISSSQLIEPQGDVSHILDADTATSAYESVDFGQIPEVRVDENGNLV